ncbi:hypothetical protein [Helicobacter canis]|uniref:Uncharacterized protein n=1 Tax=Helicobacter canis TaxID=29419 RepID=A0A5M9QTP0_9HELI|nr:hypothetical protein [Helicobacter canis]KAA8711152.1 hypothetical protein F4V45_01335 [Helicobacter canis]
MQIDSVASIVYGRNRFLIKSFFDFYLKMANKKVNPDDRARLKNDWKEYVKLRGHCKVPFFENTTRHSNYLPTFENDPSLTQEFLHLAKAVEYYQKWRKSLSKEEIKKIYIANTKERHAYYANNSLEKIDELVESCETTTMQNNQILKQTLIEFHNAISHLHAVILYSGEANKTRAKNHFIRGALDSYKALIKDYYHLLSDESKKLEVDRIRKLRKMEYQNIGNDGNKKTIFDEYENIAQDILRLKNSK